MAVEFDTDKSAGFRQNPVEGFRGLLGCKNVSLYLKVVFIKSKFWGTIIQVSIPGNQSVRVTKELIYAKKNLCY